MENNSGLQAGITFNGGNIINANMFSDVTIQ